MGMIISFWHPFLCFHFYWVADFISNPIDFSCILKCGVRISCSPRLATFSASHCQIIIFTSVLLRENCEIFRNHLKLWFQNSCIDIARKKLYNLGHAYCVGTDSSLLFIYVSSMNRQASQTSYQSCKYYYNNNNKLRKITSSCIVFALFGFV